MRLMIAVGGLLFALSGSAMAAQVYKWIDAQGVTHFGTQPPSGQPVTRINTKSSIPPVATPSNPASGADSAQQEADKKVKQEVAKNEQEMKQYCERLRTDLAHLKNNPRLRVEEKGEVRRLGEDERQSRIAEAEKRIADDCK